MTSLRTFAARSLGYTCLILFALVSRDAVAQAAVDVTFLPGEYSKTVAIPRVSGTLTVRVHSPDLICRWPSRSDLEQKFQDQPSNLARLLEYMELNGTATGTDIMNAMNVLMNWWVGTRGPKPVVLLSGVSQAAIDSRLVGSSNYEYTHETACLDIEAARSGTLEVRRLLRAYLGRPAPATPPSATGNIR